MTNADLYPWQDVFRKAGFDAPYPFVPDGDSHRCFFPSHGYDEIDGHYTAFFCNSDLVIEIYNDVTGEELKEILPAFTL